MGIRDWLAIIVIVFIVLILLDGFRRKWQERKNRIVLKLDKNIPPPSPDDEEILTKSELPNGGARTKPRYSSSKEVPVLMESVDLDADEFEEFADDDDYAADETDDIDEADGLMNALDTDDEQDLEGFSAAQEGAEDSPREDPRQAARMDSKSKAGRARSEPRAQPRQEVQDSRSRKAERIEPTFGNADLTFAKDDQGEMNLEHHDLFDNGEDSNVSETDAQEQAQEVIIINVMARPDTLLEGDRLLPVLLKLGMRLGEMSIFHRHAGMDGKGPVMFSMANMLKPGTFAMSDMETFKTPGVSFFMQLPNKLGNMQCFEQMLKTADAVRNELNAQLKDENRSVFTRQTIEHSRQRIRDFELEMLARK